MNRQMLILSAALTAFAVSAVTSYLRYPRLKPVDPAAPKTAAARLSRPAAKNPLPHQGDERILRLALLDRKDGSIKGGYRKNPFRPVFRDEVKLAKLRAEELQAAAAKKQAAAQSAPLPPKQEVIMPESPRRELANFTYLGLMKKNGVFTVFLTRDGKEIILVKKGQVFGNGKYEASSITDQTLVISVLESGEDIVVPLHENKPLKTDEKKEKIVPEKAG